MQESKSIKNWAEDERPREKMIQKGSSALTDAELLAILISSGTKEKSALDLAREILELAHKNLNELGKLTLPELQKVKGIGEARAITISAALEIGRRRQAGENLDRLKIIKSKDALPVIFPMLQDLNYESFIVVFLNTASRLIKAEEVSKGGINATIVDIRKILKLALLYNSCNLIIAHNHPSGNLKPSEQDKFITAKLKESAAMMEIRLLDHIIISGNEYLSFTDEGYL